MMERLIFDKKALKLRSLERHDIDFLLKLENDKTLWKYSETTKPFTRSEMKAYISSAKHDILVNNQYRFVVDVNNTAVGCIDLYSYDYIKRCASVGIVILEKYRKLGYGSSALNKLIKYAFNDLKINKLFAKIKEKNYKSIYLFKSCGFKKLSNGNYFLSNK